MRGGTERGGRGEGEMREGTERGGRGGGGGGGGGEQERKIVIFVDKKENDLQHTGSRRHVP